MLFGVTVLLHFIKILSGSRRAWERGCKKYFPKSKLPQVIKW
jgi:hypothetical protein